MHNGTLGLRMRNARKRAGLSLKEVGIQVAQAIGRRTPFTPQNVQQWEVGKKTKGAEPIAVTPSPEALLAFARLVKLTDTIWLVSGVEIAGSTATEPIPTEGRVVAIIKPDAAIKKPINYQSDQRVHTQVNCSERSFGMEVFDRRNMPEFQLGDRVVFDPIVKPEPGVMVFAAVDGAPVFARYTEPTHRKGQWICKLQALDRAWGFVEADSKNGDRIIGVLVEHTKLGPRPRYAP